MMMKRYSCCMPLIALFVFLINIAAAQSPVKPAAKPAAKLVNKFKPVGLQSFLGKRTGSIITCPAEEGKILATLPLTVTDSKNNSYTISSYQLAYKRLVVTEDEETGKTSPTTNLVANRFTVTPLPEIWQTNIAETLHTGEELLFFDIIATDKTGHRFFAPQLKIVVH